MLNSRNLLPIMFLRSTTILLSLLALSATSNGVSAQAPPCAAEFQPIRASVEKEGAAVKALADRKAPREQVCAQIKKFASVEAKYVKFLNDNQSWCGIPPQVVEQVKGSHNHTLKLRTQVCSGGGGMGGGPQAGPPPGPGLSEALGTAQAVTPPSQKSTRGTYDTLTGNPFQR